MKTELNDRILWNDGTNQVKPEKVPELFLLGVSQDKIIVDELNEEIKRFNQLADEPILIEKTTNAPFDFSWNIPDLYQNLNIEQHLLMELAARGKAGDPAYLNRTRLEMSEVEDRNLQPLIKTLIYIVARLKAEGKVWGVGRGSSCASLILHLIGIHEVDPVKYGIPHTEFFHD